MSQDCFYRRIYVKSRIKQGEVVRGIINVDY